MLVAILVLSAYTHLWNPAGFPPWNVDESVYIEQALDAMNYKILSDKHDHPFLGWTILAGFMHVTGYPDSFVTSEDASSIGMLYGAPRILMGLLAVLDTFLIYKIVERGFGRRAAPIAAVLFAAMPVSLTLRMVLLDSILLPFVLSSVLLAMYACGPDPKSNSVTGGRAPLQPAPDKAHLLVLLSGVCMGCAMLVKIPSLVMIPLVLALVWSAGKRPGRMLLWLVPVILIAAAWPASAALEGEFDQWIKGVLWQTDRYGQNMLNVLQQYTSVALVQGHDPDILTHPAILLMATISLFRVDPIMISLGAIGLVFAAAIRSRFLMLWAVPVLLFFGLIGYVEWFHLGMLWTAMCIATAALISGRIERASAGRRGPDRQCTLLLVAVLVAASLGLSTSGVLVHWDSTSAYSEAVSFTLQNYADSDTDIIMRGVTESLLSNVYNLTGSGTADDLPKHIHPVKTKRIVMIESINRIEQARHLLETHYGIVNTVPPEADVHQRHLEIYDSGTRVAEFHGPPKPDTPIPSAVYEYTGHSVDVTEWHPPEWSSLSTYGPTGRALHLDGTAYVTLADAPGLDLDGANPFSITFWIKMTDPREPGSSIMSKAGKDLHPGIVMWAKPGGGISLRLTDGEKTQITVNTFSGVTDGRWHHIVFTYDGSGYRNGLDVYVDGRIDNLRRHSSSLAGSIASDHPLVIGAGSTEGKAVQDVTLDDIMVYSTRLPADYVSDVHECHVEMATVSDAGGDGVIDALTGDCAYMGAYNDALLMHLEFEGDLSDSSDNGNGGTAHGGVKYA